MKRRAHRVRSIRIAGRSLFLLSLAGTASACATAGPPDTAVLAFRDPRPQDWETERDYYETCARKLRVGDATAMGQKIDFARMRRASLYAVRYEAEYQELQGRLTAAAELKDWNAIVDLTAQIQAVNQADIRSHVLRAVAMRELKRDGDAGFEEGVARSLLDSIVAGRAGDDDTPWTVYRLEEVFDVLAYQGYAVEYQSFYRSRRRSLAHVRARRLSDGGPRDVYFDVGDLLKARVDPASLQ
jgi:hypothetical protein